MPLPLPRISSRISVLAALLASLAWGPVRADLSVEIRGLEGPLRDNVEARLSIRDYAERDGAAEAEVRRLHRRAEGEIREALQAFGYYEASVVGALEGAGDEWEASYQVQPGPPVLLGEVRVEVIGSGAGLAALEEAARDNGLRRGERLEHARYEDAKAKLLRAAYRNGFLDAQFRERQLAVDVAARRADVHVQLETNERFFFGPVTITQEGMDEAFLRRYVPIVPGAPFDPQVLVDTQFALSDLGYFGSVDVQPRRERVEEWRIPVDIALAPRAPRRYDVGVGYGTDTGARLSLGVEFRQLTVTGHKLRTDFRLSEVKNSLGGEYRIPLGTSAGEYLGLASAYTEEAVGDGQSRHFDAGVSLQRTPGDWPRRVYLNYLYEESIFPATGADTVMLLMPGVSLSRDEVDDAIHARRGWYLLLDTHGGHRAVVSDTSFLQGRALLRGAWPVAERGRVFGRLELGANAAEQFGALPASQRFFAGGDQSVRGYAYQSLAPLDAAGKTVGGKYLVATSLEYEHRLWGNWGAALFTDAGNASMDPWPDLARGAGVGVRYRAPIGTLQVDLAHPLDGTERGIRPHIGIRIGL